MGFFFTLAELFKVKYELTSPPSEKIKRQDFEKSFGITRKKYGLQDATTNQVKPRT